MMFPRSRVAILGLAVLASVVAAWAMNERPAQTAADSNQRYYWTVRLHYLAILPGEPITERPHALNLRCFETPEAAEQARAEMSAHGFELPVLVAGDFPQWVPAAALRQLQVVAFLGLPPPQGACE